MDNGSIAYVKGKEYLSENDGQITDEEFDAYHRMTSEPKFFKYFQRIEKPKFEGSVDNLKQHKTFYMVLVEDSPTAPKIRHDDYDSAFQECMRLSKQEGKTAYVLISATEIEQIPSVKQLV